MTDPLVQQAIEVHRASLALWGQSVRLALEANKAWLGLWAPAVLRVSVDFRVSLEHEARTARLVRRGIPETLARQGLRVV